MYSYILLFIATLLQAGSFAVTKLYQKNNGSSIEEGLKFSTIGSVFTSLIFYVSINGFKLEISAFSLIMAILSTLLITAYTLLGFKIMEGGQLSFYTLFLLTGGMLVPYVWGILFLEEPFSVLRTIGLMLIVISIIITESSNKQTDKKQLLLCVAVFLLNGFVSVVSKEHQINSNAVSSSDFVTLSNIVRDIMFMPVLAFINKRKKNGKKEKGSGVHMKAIILAGISAVLGGISYLQQLIGAKNLPATVLYPILTGGCIIFTALAGWIFFGEKPDKRHMAGILVCFVGTCLFL